MIVKQIIWIGGSRKRLKKFPVEAREAAGYQLWQVQCGGDPDDCKPMAAIGPGVSEIRIHKPNEHRVIYVAKFSEAVYVLHAFEKKTQQTQQLDIEVARAAYAKIKKIREGTY